MNTSSKKKQSLYLVVGILFVLTLLFFLGSILGLGVMTAKYQTGTQTSRLFSWISGKSEVAESNSAEEVKKDTRTDSVVPPTPNPRVYARVVPLPKPAVMGGMPLQQAISERRTRREFADKALSLQKLSQLLWSAQGITEVGGKKRAAPSAYEVYPITMYVVVRQVAGLAPGLYEYLPETHSLGTILTKKESEVLSMPDAGTALTELEGMQTVVKTSPVVLVMTAAYGKGFDIMRESAATSALLEAGHVGQNLYLQAESLKLATVVVAGFNSSDIVKAFNLDPAEDVVYLVPVGERVVSKK